MKTSFLTVVSVLSAIVASTSAFATDENTVTSKAYVDAMDALKQDKIDAGTQGSVVIYDGTDANGQTQFDEVGIYDGSATYSNSDADKLITAGTVHNFAATVETLTVPDNKLTPVNADGSACSGNNCNLWQISSGTTALTTQGTFAPLTAAACKTYGASVSSNSECCSGITRVRTALGAPLLCGCQTLDDCPSGSTVCSDMHFCS